MNDRQQNRTTTRRGFLRHGAAALGAAAMLHTRVLSSPEERGREWPAFHGPDRNNISPETGLLKEWPEGGPRLVWKYADCGGGHACVSIADGRIFTSGDFADKEFVIALDLDGKLLWKVENGSSWKTPIPGARTTPAWQEGVLYHLGPHGRLAALAADSGREIWAVDLKVQFEARHGTWALSENVALDGDAVLCVPGGAKGRIVALDRRTGKPLWVNTEIEEIAAYCSPVVVTHGGVRQMITMMQKSVVGVDVRTGRLLWKHPHETKNDQNVTMPICRDGYVYVSSGHGAGGRLLKIAPDSGGVEQIWAGTDLDNCHGGVILLDSRLYGSGCRLFGKGLLCVDFLTGKTLWNNKEIGKVSLTFADGLLYCQGEKGTMMLVQADEKGGRVVSRFDLPKKDKKPCYAHPVVCGGRLYLRHGPELFAYDVRR